MRYRTKSKFYVIGHNAADDKQKIAPWLASQASHLEIDVQQKYHGFVAQHSRIKGFLSNILLFMRGVPLQEMTNLVTAQNKSLYIDYKWGNIDALVQFLQQRKILYRCAFVVYGRKRAERLKQLAPQCDVFLHIGRRTAQVFEYKTNDHKIGVCLPPRLLTKQNVAYMQKHNAKILATFINSHNDFVNAFSQGVVGITTDRPHLTAFASRTVVKSSRTTIRPSTYTAGKERTRDYTQPDSSLVLAQVI